MLNNIVWATWAKCVTISDGVVAEKALLRVLLCLLLEACPVQWTCKGRAAPRPSLWKSCWELEQLLKRRLCLHFKLGMCFCYLNKTYCPDRNNWLSLFISFYLFWTPNCFKWQIITTVLFVCYPLSQSRNIKKKWLKESFGMSKCKQTLSTLL